MYTGLTGALKIGDDFETVAYISGWSLDDQTEITEIRKVGQRYKEAYAGVQSWSASADGVVVFEDRDGRIGQQQLFRTKHEGDKVMLRFYLHDSRKPYANEDVWFEGYGLIESLSVDLSAEGVANISISIKGTGALNLISLPLNRELGTGDRIDVVREFLDLKVNTDGILEASYDAEHEDRIEPIMNEAENTGIRVTLGKGIIRSKGGN